MSKEVIKINNTIVVSAGDSLTQATFSSNYLAIIRKKLQGKHYEFVNAGQVGDTAENLLKRIRKHVIPLNPNFITILIGTNDARQDTEIKQALEAFRKNIESIISEIQNNTKATIALISLPPLGENPNSNKNKKVAMYNEILKDIASKKNLRYLPFFEKLIPILINKTPIDSSEFKLNLASALTKSAFQKYILRKNWDVISMKNGFSIFTDGIHLNDRSGNILADLIKEWLLSNE
jgi:acyl-CoA thioesterase-1